MKPQISEERLHQLIRAGFNLQCKSQGRGRANTSFSLQVIKPRSFCAGAIVPVARACPEVAHAFMLRNPLEVVSSFTQIMGRVFAGGGEGEPISPDKLEFFLSLFDLPVLLPPPSSSSRYSARAAVARAATEAVRSDFSPSLPVFMSVYWALHVLCAVDAREDAKGGGGEGGGGGGVDLLVFHYEDLIEDPAQGRKRKTLRVALSV